MQTVDNAERSGVGAGSCRGISLRRTWAGLLAFYALALALNATSLHRNNEHMPYGTLRSFWVAVSAPAARVASACGLNRPRALLAETLGAALNE